MRAKGRKIRIATFGVLGATLLGCFAGGVSVIADRDSDYSEVASVQGEKKVLKASDLWQASEETILLDNAEIPDYAKYGLYYEKNDGKFSWVNESDEDLHLEEWERYGLKVSSKGESIQFKNVINLKEYTKGDELLSILPMPAAQGTKDYNVLKFTLTDVEDPSAYFSFSLKGEDFNQCCGWEIENPAVTASNRNTSGTSIGGFRLQSRLNGRTYMADNTAVTMKRYDYYTFSYDYSENALYFSLRNENGLAKIVDFDDVQSVGAGNAWSGFPSGKVRLSVKADELSVARVNYMILAAFNQKMYGERLDDYAAPSLYLEQTAYVAPKAEAGRSYRVFDCAAYDVVDGKITPEVTVTDASGVEFPVLNNSFVPSVQGIYKVTYTATDAAGNVKKTSVNVTCEKKLPDLKIELSDVGEFSRDVGEPILLPQATVSGGSGKYAVEDKTIRLDSLQEIESDDGKFTPIFGGEYKVTYEATDYIGNVAQTSVIYSVENNYKPVLQGEIQKLKKLYCGVAFDIPVPQALDYSDPIGGVKAAEYRITATGENGKTADVTRGGGLYFR